MRGVLNDSQIQSEFLLPAARLEVLKGVDLEHDDQEQSYEALLQLDTDIREAIDREWFAIDPIETRGPGVLHPLRMAWTLTSAFEDCANMSGLASFFESDSGRYAHETIESLRKLSSEQIAQLLEAAHATFPGDLDALEQRFFEYGTSMRFRLLAAQRSPSLFFQDV